MHCENSGTVPRREALPCAKVIAVMRERGPEKF